MAVHVFAIFLQPLGRRVDLEEYYKAIVTPGIFIPCCSPKCAHCHFFSLKGHGAKDQSVTDSVFFFFVEDISMSYRTSVVKVPDYSSSSFSTEGFSVYKNVQTGMCINL